MIPRGSGFRDGQPLLDPVTVIALVVSLMAVGLVAGILPALRAARTEPAEALRA